MVVPEQVSDADMILLARDIAKQIEAELEYPGQIKVNVIRELDYLRVLFACLWLSAGSSFVLRQNGQ